MVAGQAPATLEWRSISGKKEEKKGNNNTGITEAHLHLRRKRKVRSEQVSITCIHPARFTSRHRIREDRINTHKKKNETKKNNSTSKKNNRNRDQNQRKKVPSYEYCCIYDWLETPTRYVCVPIAGFSSWASRNFCLTVPTRYVCVPIAGFSSWASRNFCLSVPLNGSTDPLSGSRSTANRSHRSSCQPGGVIRYTYQHKKTEQTRKHYERS